MDFLSNLNLNKNELQNVRIQNLAKEPASPVAGQMYFNTADKTLYVWTGTEWRNALYIYTGETLTAALKLKLDGITEGATKVEASGTNGYIKINGTETKVYTHPGSGTNPHGTTKKDLGLDNVENKSAATILNELTKAKIVEKLGFTPREIKVGTDADKGTATGSRIVYIANDTKKIWLDNAADAWLQVGGQDTIAWGNVTGKPATFTSPIATATRLGGIKVGSGLSVTADGTLSAGDVMETYVVKTERFTATANQTTFTLAKGSYRTGAGLLAVYINGARQSNDIVTEVSTTQFKLPALAEGTVVLAEYVQIMDLNPYAAHASEHLTDGTDPIPLATASADGLMSKEVFATAMEAVSALTAHISNKSNTHGVTKSQVGLGNVDNTADKDKPVSTAVQTALNGKLDTSLKGTKNGLAELDANGQVPASQLPSYVDDVIEGYLSGGKFYSDSGKTTEIAGETGKIYVDLTSSKTYRWSGTAYAVISETIALGETSSTAYRGDRGKTAYDHSQSAHARTDATKTAKSSTNGNVLINGTETVVYTHPSNHAASMITQDATHRFVSDTEKTAWNARPKKYAVDVGDGKTTEITVTHSLGTQDVTVMVRETTSPYNKVYCDVQIISTTQVKLLFATAPATGAYRCIVTG